MPETVYSGLKDGASRHSHEELSVALKAYTDAVIGNPSKRLSASWIDGLNGILDAYLGPCPEKFVYDGKEYTPKSFAQELGIRRDDYVVFTAMTHHPLYTAFPLEIPDNWNWSPFCNVTKEELGRIVDVSLRKGYAVNWRPTSARTDSASGRAVRSFRSSRRRKFLRRTARAGKGLPTTRFGNGRS